MDGLSTSLNSSNIGGHICGNHLCYADDMCLISLSSAGMQLLLNICNDYADQHSLLYNNNNNHLYSHKQLHVHGTYKGISTKLQLH